MLRLRLYPSGDIYLAPHTIQSVQASPNGEVSLVQTSGGVIKAAHPPAEIVIGMTKASQPFLSNAYHAWDVATQRPVNLETEKGQN